MDEREDELFRYGCLRFGARPLANFFDLLRHFAYVADAPLPPIFYPMQTCGYYDARVGGFSPYPVPAPD